MHEKYPVCIMCGLENPKCRNRASKVHYPSNAIPIPAGCPWEEPASPLAAPQSCPCQLPGLCWHTWTWNSFLPSSSHPSHTALFIQPRVPGVLQHHIHHSLTTGTSSLLLSQQLLQHPRRNSRLLPTSVKCCHFPRCTENAPKEWHQELCVQRRGRMTESASAFLTSQSSLELSKRSLWCTHGTTIREGQGTPLGLGNIFQLIAFHDTWTCGASFVPNISQGWRGKSTPHGVAEAKQNPLIHSAPLSPTKADPAPQQLSTLNGLSHV